MERSRCCIRTRRDRASIGTVGGGPEGSVPPSEGCVRACVASWESSGVTAYFRSSSYLHCEFTSSQLAVINSDTISDTMPRCRVHVGYYYITKTPSGYITGSRAWRWTQTAYN